MSYTVLARRYRSATFDQIVGQEHIAQTLKKAIATGRIAHAYLFCGTRGTGKTSTARILAKALNCLSTDKPTPTPCGKCDSCLAIARGDDLDVIEIDAASNTGVDNVREIIENSQYRPARSRFKVYIIDEVHMLSKSAFNALLKTLEEPPEHVKFILATTEPEKVLPTILSRCQRYDFRNISSKEIADHLENICKQEKIDADPDALALIARAGAGSMRDALSLLDRLLSLGEKHLDSAAVEQMLGLPRAQRVGQLAIAIGSGNVKETLSQTDAMIASGLSSDALIVALADHLRNLLIARVCGSDSALLDLPGQTPGALASQAEKFDPTVLAQDIAILEELRRNMRQNQTGRALLDATLVRLALAEQFSSISQLLSGEKPAAPSPVQKKKLEPLEPIVATSASDDLEDDLPAVGKVWTGPSLKEALAQQPPAIQPPPSVPAGPVADDDLWGQLLAQLEHQGSVVGALRLASMTGIEDGQAVIRFPSNGATFARTWSANGKRDTIAKTLTELRGQPTGVRFEIAEEEQAAVAAAPPSRTGAAIPPEVDQDPLVQWVLKEFGGRIERVE